MKVHQFPDRIIEVGQEKYLYFGGTAYLGLAANTDFQQLLIKNIQIWGAAYGSSRNANIQIEVYDAGEQFLAKFIHAEATATVSSGMLAAKLVIEELMPNTDVFFHFPNTHKALEVKNSLPFLIENELNPRLLDDKIERITILTDGVTIFETKPVDLTILNTISINKKITFIVDESHSLGILGADGCGLFSTINANNIARKISIASLGKALAVTGGVIASDNKFIDKIKNNPSFVSSAGMSPALCQTMADTAAIYKSQHAQLKSNLKFIESHLIKSSAFAFNPDYPIIYPNIVEINALLLKNKIIITNFKYTNGGQDLNRIVITANHIEEDLIKLTTVLNQHQF